MWVDRYCIDQNDLKDKAEQIPQMGNYYKNSQGTIVWLHDIEYENNINKTEWLSRLWTLQEWELNENRWIITNNKKIIKYKSDNTKNLIPKSRLILSKEYNIIPSLEKMLITSNYLNCCKKVDKIHGIIGMLKYSEYINFDNINISISEDVLNEVLKIASKKEYLYLDLLSIKNNINDDYLFYVLELKKLYLSLFSSDAANHGKEGIFTYKGIFVEIKEIPLMNFNKIDKNDFLNNTKNYLANLIEFKNVEYEHKYEKMILLIRKIIESEKIFIYKIVNSHFISLLFTYDIIENIRNKNNIIYMSNSKYGRIHNKSFDTVLKESNNIFSIIGFSIIKYNKKIRYNNIHELFNVYHNYIL
jgi:hypothetical protein